MIGFLLHLEELCAWIHGLFFTFANDNWREVLVGPWRPVAVTILIVLTLEEFFALLLVHSNV